MSSSESSNNSSNAEPKSIVGIYKTRTNPKAFEGIEEGNNSPCDEVSFSKQLDAMGWTKVLVDARPNLPSWSNAKKSVSEILLGDEEEELPLRVGACSCSSYSPSMSAKELLAKYGGGASLTVPFGHSVLIANAKDALHRWINQGGKPVMDFLAGNVVDYLLSSPSDKGDDVASESYEGSGLTEWIEDIKLT